MRKYSIHESRSDSTRIALYENAGKIEGILSFYNHEVVEHFKIH